VANALWGNVTNDLADLAKALWGNVTNNLSDLAGALSDQMSNLGSVAYALSKVVDSVDSVASALWSGFHGSFYLADLGIALWTNWGGSSFNFSDLAGALSNQVSNLGSVAYALSKVIDSVDSVASALWNGFHGSFYLSDVANALWKNWGGSSFNFSDLAGALSNQVSNLGSVVYALSKVIDSVDSVASALWNGFHGSFYLSDVGNALWTNWGGSSFNFSDLAGALSNCVNDLGSVAYALSKVIDDAGSVAYALWHGFYGSFSGSDLVGVLMSVFDLNLVAAWSIVNGL
jgi:hypothetical protein